jgi:hypothetical protein
MRSQGGHQRGIRPKEQITEGSASSIGDPVLCQMMRSVLQHMAALTERAQICHSIIGWIGVQVSRREHDARHPEPCCFQEIWPSSQPFAAVPPRRRLFIEPASVWPAAYKGEMWPTALTPTFSTFEANVVTKLAPVGRVQRSQLSAYGAWLCRRPQSKTLEPSSEGRSNRMQP